MTPPRASFDGSGIGPGLLCGPGILARGKVLGLSFFFFFGNEVEVGFFNLGF
jgi:hypothetical protein